MYYRPYVTEAKEILYIQRLIVSQVEKINERPFYKMGTVITNRVLTQTLLKIEYYYNRIRYESNQSMIIWLIVIAENALWQNKAVKYALKELSMCSVMVQ